MTNMTNIAFNSNLLHNFAGKHFLISDLVWVVQSLSELKKTGQRIGSAKEIQVAIQLLSNSKQPSFYTEETDGKHADL